MASKQILAVTGATGAQGGGVIKAALADGTFAVRAVVRNPASDKAQALVAQGVEVVQGDLNDAASLVKAFAGAYGLFAVTNYWETLSVDVEQQQAKNLAEAAKAAGVQHVVWSTLEDTRPTKLDVPILHGKYKVPHFDGKGEADKYFLESGVPTTLLYTSFYYENLIKFGMGPKRQADGTLALTIPFGDYTHPLVAADDIGAVAFGVFKAGDEFKGKWAGAVSQLITGAQMADVLSEVLGEKVNYTPVPPQVFAKFGFPGADDLGNMFSFFQDCNDIKLSHRSVEQSLKLSGGKLTSFKEWATANKAALAASLG